MEARRGRALEEYLTGAACVRAHNHMLRRTALGKAQAQRGMRFDRTHIACATSRRTATTLFLSTPTATSTATPSILHTSCHLLLCRATTPHGVLNKQQIP